MKVLGKYLVIATIDSHKRIAASFMTRRETIESLDRVFTKISDNDWIDRSGTHFHIEKNTKEYR